VTKIKTIQGEKRLHSQGFVAIWKQNSIPRMLL
jgi:hypothetical protein